MKYSCSDYIKSLLSEKKWLIEENGFEKDRTLSYESIFALNNGYMGIRGSLEEYNRISLPVTFINGIFDKSETFMRELVNLPNPLSIRFNIEKDRLCLDDQELLYFHRVLDMKKAMLVRSMVTKDSQGRISRLEFVRFISRDTVHCGGVRILFTPINYSGIVELENMIDGTVVNFADAPRFKVKHFKTTVNESLNKDDGIYLEGITRDDGIRFACASVVVNKNLGHRQFNSFGEISSEFKDLNVKQGKTYIVDKYFSYYTQKDKLNKNLKQTCQKELSRFVQAGFEKDLKKHTEVYEKMWKMADIEIEGDDKLNKSIRFNIFQLMSSGNENDNRVNIGSKLMAGEEYGGHAFWDTELFMLPFFNYVFPQTAKNLEEYRYNLLPAAKQNAKKTGYKGARYPWESADEGSEQCPDWTIYPDGSALPCFVAKYEQHVSAAVALGVVNYVSITNDKKFLKEKGIEVLYETACFWSSRLEYNQKKDRYEINEVTGPDEWHEPVNNNLYTNYLARYNMELVIELLEQYRLNEQDTYKQLKKKLCFNDRQLKLWQKQIDRIYLPRNKKNNLLEQFEGYFKLKDVIITEYDENDWPIKPKQLIGIDRSKTQIIKQADVVMLLYLLEEEFDRQTVIDNYHYYEKRTLHGSSLSPSIYAIMGLRVNDPSKAYRYLKRAANLDLLDLQGNGREGLHGANMGGVWQSIIFGFAGVSQKNERLCINPRLAKKWKSLKFRLNYRGRLLEFRIKNNKVDIDRIKGKKIRIIVNNKEIKV